MQRDIKVQCTTHLNTSWYSNTKRFTESLKVILINFLSYYYSHIQDSTMTSFRQTNNLLKFYKLNNYISFNITNKLISFIKKNLNQQDIKYYS